MSLTNDNNDNNLFETNFGSLNIEFFIGYAVAAIILWVICRNLLLEDVVYLSEKRRHGWKSIRILNRPCYCSTCEILLPPSTGQFCDTCGICCHSDCMKKADLLLRCKERYVKNGNSIQHLWIRGNLPLNTECELCKEDVDYHTTPGLYGFRCCWCQRSFHDECFVKYEGVDDDCDYGPFSEMIIPPTSIITARRRRTMKIHLAGIKPPDWDNWKPLIVIANTKSGSSTASEAIALLRGMLHPLQVIELGSHGPQEPLQWAVKANPRPTRVLVAGGDGTVGWVLNTIFTLGIKPIPEVAILPLGTGNDLSRVMGWGAAPPSTFDPFKILNDIKKAKCVNLDRWILEIETPRYRLPIQRAPLRTIYVYNYFSIGVDALVALNFHKTRESPFYLLSSRIINKLIYLGYGVQQVLERDCENIEKRLELYLDDELIELPELQSIIFLNIDSWGAGVKLCELSETENCISDSIIEVFGIVSSFHIAQLQVGISKPIRIGQARNVKIKLNQSCPVQADGEPWLQQMSEIRLKARGQAKLLKLNKN